MIYSPQQILNFLSTHYEKIVPLYHLAKAQNHTVTGVQLTNFQAVHNLERQLLDYKILEEKKDGAYYMGEPYFQFFTFLHNDFPLDLPAQLGKYRYSFMSLTRTLQSIPAKEVDQVRGVCGNLIDELHRFQAHLNHNTKALEEAADQLRTEEKQSYTGRIARASYLINTFLEPLNQVLAKHDQSIMEILRRLADYLQSRSLECPDDYRGGAYRELHAHLMTFYGQLEVNLRLLIRNLLPLLEQMKQQSEILAGFKILRDLYGKQDAQRYGHLLPRLLKRRHNYVYNALREGNVDSILSALDERTPPALHKEDAPLPIPWHFHAEEYRATLYKALPLDDFFLWCYGALKEREGTSIVASQFFEVAHLFFSSGLEATFTGDHSYLTLADGTLYLPKIILTHELKKS